MKSKFSLPYHEPVYFIEYNLSSSINYMDAGRYNVRIDAEIFTPLGDNDSIKVPVGRMEAFNVLIDLAIVNGHSPSIVFDMHAITMNIAEEIFDFEEQDWKREIYKYYGDDDYPLNLLVLSRLEILPAYRRQGIGRRVIKDLYNNFMGGCSFMAMKCFPLRGEAGILQEEDAYTISMEYGKMEKNQKKAFDKLYDYYNDIGFESIPGLADNILLLNPIYLDDRFNSIELD